MYLNFQQATYIQPYLWLSNTSCMRDMNVSTPTLDMLNMLSMYDHYIVCKLLKSRSGISSSRLRKYFGDIRIMTSWCKRIGTCTPGKISKMIRKWILKLIFISWLPNLPEENFGTMVSSIVTSYDNKDGFDYLIKSVLEDKGGIGLVAVPDAKLWPHATEIMQLFIPSAIYSNSKPFLLDDVPRNVPGLAKLFLFPTFVARKASALAMSPVEVIKAEIDKFGYSIRQTFVVSFISSKKSKEVHAYVFF
jgi:hypothetical protein